MNKFADILREKTDLSDEKILKLSQFNDILYEKNKVLNLTRVKKEESVHRNFLDSLNDIAVSEIKNAKKVIDIGSGCGFPAIVLAIVFDNISFTLVEATNKKVVFLQEAVKELNLSNVNVICARAEELAHNIAHREKYDFVTARAVARLSVLCELTSGYVKKYGKLIFYKGRTANEEIATARKSFNILKLKDCIATQYKITDDTDDLYMVILSKFYSLPSNFPRSYSKIMQDSKK